MKKISVFLSTALFFTLPVNADYQGIVTKIIDGDTVYIKSNDSMHKVRFLDIDAPEHDQPYGYTSKNNLNNLIFQKLVSVKTNKQDRYGRDLGYIFYNGLNINEEQVKDGLAWAYRYHGKASSSTMSLLEETAKNNQVGLWKSINPIEPWKWRRANKLKESL